MANQSKQERVPPQKGQPNGKVPAQVIFGTALEHVTLTGKCDGGKSILAKCNGSSVTIKVIENAGKCDIAVFCLDNNNKEIQNTRTKIPPGQILPIYVAPNGTDRVELECIQADLNPECKVKLAV